jgi:alkaline phosphatase
MVLALLVAAAAAGAADPPAAKNVILMISDGQGFNAAKAAGYYNGAPAVYESFPVRLAMQTTSADNPAGYDPAQMAAGLGYCLTGATDSASAATAMYTGVKNHDGEINWTTDDQPITTYFEKAAKAGRSIGAVSSVQFSHATPAAVYGHNSSRGNYAAIGYEGLYGANPVNDLADSSSNPLAGDNNNYNSMNYHGNMTVLMGAGHGDYDDNGQFDAGKTDQYLGGTTAWNDIKDGTVPNGWTYVETKAGFEAVAAGGVAAAPARLLGVAQVNTTLQQARAAGNPPNGNVPALATMTTAALNVLGKNGNGFAVMIEGGAVDWAGHAKQLDRLIEEQTDFNNAVAAAVAWVQANSNWDETLLIVTADHETGGLMGAGTYADNNSNGAFDAGDEFLGYKPLANNGVGVLPGGQWSSGNHTNQLVPLYAKGAGSDLFLAKVIGTDPNLAGYYGLDSGVWTGQYIDNTSIYSVMAEASDVPEPATLSLLALGALAIRRRAGRRRRSS